MNWYYEKNGQPQGPYNLEEILPMIKPDTLVWRENSLEDWITAEQHPLLLFIFSNNSSQKILPLIPQVENKNYNLIISIPKIPINSDFSGAIKIALYINGKYHSTQEAADIGGKTIGGMENIWTSTERLEFFLDNTDNNVSLKFVFKGELILMRFAGINKFFGGQNTITIYSEKEFLIENISDQSITKVLLTYKSKNKKITLKEIANVDFSQFNLICQLRDDNYTQV